MLFRSIKLRLTSGRLRQKWRLFSFIILRLACLHMMQTTCHHVQRSIFGYAERDMGREVLSCVLVPGRFESRVDLVDRRRLCEMMEARDLPPMVTLDVYRNVGDWSLV